MIPMTTSSWRALLRAGLIIWSAAIGISCAWANTPVSRFSPRQRFLQFSANIRSSDDISNSSPSEIRNLLLSHLNLANPHVTLTWPADRCSIVISYADFVRHYDDLWFPSRDDLW